MSDEVEIRKMSVKEVMGVQELVKKANKSKSDDSQLGLLRDLIRLAVVGAEEISDEDFNSFPIGELSDLSNEVLAFSGLGDTPAGN